MKEINCISTDKLNCQSCDFMDYCAHPNNPERKKVLLRAAAVEMYGTLTAVRGYLAEINPQGQGILRLVENTLAKAEGRDGREGE